MIVTLRVSRDGESMDVQVTLQESRQAAGGEPPPEDSPDVPSPGELLHPGTERNILCQCFQRGCARSDAECPADFFWYDDPSKIVDSYRIPQFTVRDSTFISSSFHNGSV